jgi:hypothetical protein
MMMFFKKYITWIFGAIVMSVVSYYLIFCQELLIFKIVGIIFASFFLFFIVRDVIILKKINNDKIKAKHKKITVVDYIFSVLLICVLFALIFIDTKIIRIIALLILVISLVSVNIRDYIRKKKGNNFLNDK